jgi:hypothetical protein
MKNLLLKGQQEPLLLDRLLTVGKQRGLLKAGATQRFASMHVLAWVCSLSNVECVGETLRSVLDDPMVLVPGLRTTAIGWRTIATQSGKSAHGIGAAEGMHLLHVLEQADAPADRLELASVQRLGQMLQQYYDLSGGKAT